MVALEKGFSYLQLLMQKLLQNSEQGVNLATKDFILVSLLSWVNVSLLFVV